MQAWPLPGLCLGDSPPASQSFTPQLGWGFEMGWHIWFVFVGFLEIVVDSNVRNNVEIALYTCLVSL